MGRCEKEGRPGEGGGRRSGGNAWKREQRGWPSGSAWRLATGDHPGAHRGRGHQKLMEGGRMIEDEGFFRSL